MELNVEVYSSASNSIPGPEGAAMLREAVNSLRHNLLNIDVMRVREKGQNMRKQMEDLIGLMLTYEEQQQQEQQEQLQTAPQDVTYT
jgi:predicted ATP-grasp superfamily ATP-dependent carboligase